MTVTVAGSIDGGSTSSTTTACAADGPVLVTLTRKRIGPPAIGSPPERSTALPICTSADGTTGVTRRALWSSGVGSAVASVTVAVLLNGGRRQALVHQADEIGSRAGVPGARSPIAQVTDRAGDRAGVVVAPTMSCADCTATPAGTVSVTLTVRATDGPALATSIVHAAVVPGTIVAASATLVIDTSALRRQRGRRRRRCCPTDPDRWSTSSTVAELASDAERRRRVDRRRDRDHPARRRRAVVDRHGAELAAHRAGGDRARRAAERPPERRSGPAGSWSVTTTACATDGPSLTTVSCHVTGLPGPRRRAGLGDAHVGARADRVGRPPTELFVGCGSGVPAVTLAVFVVLPATKSAAIVPLIVTVAVAAAATSPSGHDTLAATLQAMPADDVAVTAVRPAGIGSLTTADRDVDGPLFVTVIVHCAAARRRTSPTPPS